MRLSDIMSGANLAVFPEIGLVIFLLVFSAVTIRVFSRRRPEEFRRCAAIVLDDEGARP
jgi:cbb3-type cytochrome oxidase subunit 3